MFDLNKMTNAELEHFILKLRKQERDIQIDFIEALAEIDVRKMYLDEGFSSLFSYVTKKMGYSEASAQKRIQLARCGLKFPELMQLIKEGKIHMSGASAIAPHLTEENKTELFERVKNKTLDEIRWIVAEFKPKPIVSDSLKIEKSVENLLSDAHETKTYHQCKVTYSPLKSAQEVKPITSERATIRFSCSKKFVETLKRCQELLQSSGETDFEHVFQKTMEAFLEKKDPQKRQERRDAKEAEAKKIKVTETKSREPVCKPKRTPILVKAKDLVFKNHSHQCCYTSAEGIRCSARSNLQVDHIKSVCHGGENTLENLQLLCAAHHRQKTERQLGKNFMEGLGREGYVMQIRNKNEQIGYG